MTTRHNGWKRRISTSFWICIFAVSSLAAQTGPKALTFDDFIRIKRVTDLQISPDGGFLAYVVTVMDLKTNSGNSDIWIVPSRGGEARRLTNGPGADFSPRFSPDGRKIAFLSSRNGSVQVWLIDPEGGEATPLTCAESGISSFIWSPDGSRLAYTSSVLPGERIEPGAKADSRIKARIFDQLLARHWNSWFDGTRSHVFVVSVNGSAPVDVTPGDYDTPPSALAGTPDYTFSADGTEICFARNIDPQLRLGLGTNNDLFLVPSGGGESRKITENKASDNNPVYSPDGNLIAFRAMSRPGFEADRYRLMVFDRKTGKTRNLTEALDYSVNEIIWTPAGKALIWTAEEKGRSVVFKTDLASEKTERIFDGRSVSSPALSPDGGTIYFLAQSLVKPNDVYAADLKTKSVTPLTRTNDDLLSGIRLSPAEEFWFTGGGKDRIHGFLLKPPFFEPGKKYPLVILIHGGPQGAYRDDFHARWNPQLFAAPGYVVATINFHGSVGYGQAFTDSISGDYGGKAYQDIMAGLTYLQKNYPFIDASRSAAAGGSFGGYMIDWIEGHTDAFRCLVSHAGMFDLRSFWGATDELWFAEWDFGGKPWTNPAAYDKWSPSSYVKNFKTPCLVTHGAKDFRVPLEQGLQFFSSLQRMSVPSKMLVFPDEDHFFSGKPLNCEFWYKTVLDWLALYLKN